MPIKTHQEHYIDYINTNILPHIDYKQLQESYDGDKKYAQEVLCALHDAVVKCYEMSSFDSGDCQDSEGFVTLPGIVCGKNTGKIAVALLDIDLESSGEHWETNFLLDVGVVEQIPKNKALADRLVRDFIPYDYCYTSLVLNDIHIDFDNLPKVMKDMLETFQDSGHNQRRSSSWPQFEKAKNKAEKAKDTLPPKTQNKGGKKEL
ncbi:hypothetical protein FACS1894133_5770 [Clostridia bacterium]|nr:hypothetical protein FACS1894133_5770 [Clostridia bacterium]